MNVKINKTQSVCLLVIFIISNTPVLTGYTAAERNLWMAYILAFAAAVPLYLIYSRLTSLYPEKNLYEILENVFGKIFGKIISFVYMLYAVNIAAMSIRNAAEFVNIVSLERTPLPFILFFCILVCFYLALKGLRAMAKFAALFLPVLTAVLLLLDMLSFNIYDFANLEPIVINDFADIVKSGSVCFSFPLAESIIFISAVSYVKLKKGESKKIYLSGLILSVIIIITVVLNNIMVLGVPTMTKLYYPTYTAASLIDIGVVRRLEIISSSLFFTSGILKGGLALFLSYLGYKSIFGIKKEKKPKFYPVIILILAVVVTFAAYFLYPNVTELIDFTKLYSKFSLPLQLFPLVIWIVAEVKNRGKKQRESSEKNNLKEV